MNKNLHPASTTRPIAVIAIVILLTTVLLTACGGQASPQAVEPTTEASMESPTVESEQPTAEQVDATAIEPTMQATSPESDTTTPAEVSYANDVQPLFTQYCTRCHGGSKTEEGLSLSSFADVMSGSKEGAVIIPGDAENSVLAMLMVSGEMPQRGAKPSAEEIQIILDWINGGALDN